MSGARSHILSTIRTSLGRTALNEAQRAALESRLKSAESQVIPAHGQGPRETLLEQFIDEARDVDATVERLASFADVPAAVATHLKKSNSFHAGTQIKGAPQARLQELPWPGQPDLAIDFGAPSPSDDVSIALAFAGVAETGTLVMASSPNCPVSLHFLAETQIVVVCENDIVGAYEEIWKSLRSQNEQGAFMPRAVNLITGPSRTADIEQTLLLGAHGPKSLHILVVKDG